MIYFYIEKHKGTRNLKDYVSLSLRLELLVKSIIFENLSNHNNKINFEVFMPDMIEFISKVVNSITVNESLKI